MKKIILIPIMMILLVFTANASCIDNDDCSPTEVCEGGECRSESIVSLIRDLLSEVFDQLTAPLTITDDTTPTPSAPSGNGGGSSSWTGGSGICISNWTCTTWSACIGSQKTRTCTDVNDCQQDPPVYGKPSESMACQLIAIPTCTDGILNQDEEGVDCGGPCPICATCDDNIKNCHQGLCEDDVDCGGPCMPCSWWKASKSVSFWIIFTTGILTLILLFLGFWYWKLRSSAEDIGDELTKQEFFKLK